VTTATATARYGTALAMAWGRLHQQLASRAGWENHHGELPVIEGTLIRLQVQYLPGDRSPEPLWLWTSRAGASAAEVNRTWRTLAADLRLPWQQPCPPGRLTPARVRRGFRNIRQTLPDLASAPKPGKPGPGHPPGSKNRRPATRHDVGKTVKRTNPRRKPAARKVK
jgi:hypothetical protein